MRQTRRQTSTRPAQSAFRVMIPRADARRQSRPKADPRTGIPALHRSSPITCTTSSAKSASCWSRPSTLADPIRGIGDLTAPAAATARRCAKPAKGAWLDVRRTRRLPNVRRGNVGVGTKRRRRAEETRKGNLGPRTFVIRALIRRGAASRLINAVRQGPASSPAEKFPFLGGRSFSSDNKSPFCSGLQPLKTTLCTFFRSLFTPAEKFPFLGGRSFSSDNKSRFAAGFSP